MGEFNLAAIVAQVSVMAPKIPWLSTVHNKYKNTINMGWTNCNLT